MGTLEKFLEEYGKEICVMIVINITIYCGISSIQKGLLYTGSLFFTFLIYYLYRIVNSLSNLEEIKEVSRGIIEQYEDHDVLIRTPIAYHHRFDKLKKLIK